MDWDIFYLICQQESSLMILLKLLQNQVAVNSFITREKLLLQMKISLGAKSATQESSASAGKLPLQARALSSAPTATGVITWTRGTQYLACGLAPQVSMLRQQ